MGEVTIFYKVTPDKHLSVGGMPHRGSATAYSGDAEAVFEAVLSILSALGYRREVALTTFWEICEGEYPGERMRDVD